VALIYFDGTPRLVHIAEMNISIQTSYKVLISDVRIPAHAKNFSLMIDLGSYLQVFRIQTIDYKRFS
jgi:hypothetical protein